MVRIGNKLLVFSIAIACSVLLGIMPCLAANVPPNGAITNPAPEGYYVDYSDGDQIKPLQIPAWGFDDGAFTYGSTVYDVSSDSEFYDALSAASSSGGIIQIAAGSYTLDSKAVIPSNVIIQGAGVDQTTLVFGRGIKPDTSGLEAKYQTNIVLRDLTVDANDKSFIAISMRMCNNVLIERLVCRDGRRLGIRLPSTTKWTVRYVETYNHGIYHGLAASIETADAYPGTEWPSFFSIYSCKMYNCKDHGLDLHAEYGEVAGCHIYGNIYGQSKQPDSVEVYLHNILFGDGSNYATRTYGTERATSSMVYYYDIKYGSGYKRAAHIGGEDNGQAPGQSFWSYNTYGSGSILSVSNGTVYVDPASSTEAATSGTTTAPQSMIDAVNALRNPQGGMPTVDSFMASPSSIAAGQSATLSWTTTYATSVDIDHGVGTGLAPDGSTSVSPTETTIYTLTATGTEGTDTATVTVEVGPPAPTYALTVNNGSGDGSYVEGAIVAISADSPGAGEAFEAWTGDTAYVADVNDANTSVTMPAQAITVTATYAALPPIVDSFTATPSAILEGESATLSWTTTNATSVDIDNGVGTGLSPVGSTSVSPMTTTMYTLTATGPGGTNTATVTLNVGPSPNSGVIAALNCGGDAYTSVAGIYYDVDQYYQNGEVYSTTRPIRGTSDNVLYQSYRRGVVGILNYAIPVSNGDYIVTLQFAEVEEKKAGNRVFDVMLEDTLVINDLDIVAVAGSFAAYEVTFPVTVSDGNLDIYMTASINNPVISAILVQEAGGAM